MVDTFFIVLILMIPIASSVLDGDEDTIFCDQFERMCNSPTTCADGAQCLVNCGNYGSSCIDDCFMKLPEDEASDLHVLQFCAIEACAFIGHCSLEDFNAPECVQCRLDVTQDPFAFGCGVEGAACGI